MLQITEWESFATLPLPLGHGLASYVPPSHLTPVLETFSNSELGWVESRRRGLWLWTFPCERGGVGSRGAEVRIHFWNGWWVHSSTGLDSPNSKQSCSHIGYMLRHVVFEILRKLNRFARKDRQSCSRGIILSKRISGQTLPNMIIKWKKLWFEMREKLIDERLY